MLNELSLTHLLPLLPILLLGIRQNKPRRAHGIILQPDAEPAQAPLSALMREFVEDRDPIDPSARGLVKYLDPIDALTVTRCADAHMRWADPRTSRHEIKPRQCRSFWCPWCIRRAHARRSRYQYLKLQSIQPKDDDKVRLMNMVVELPVPLHALVRHDPDCMNAWRKTVEKTIAAAYGAKGRRGVSFDRAFWSAHGAIFNFHAIGDEGTPWPKYFPHFDILLSAYHLGGDAMRKMPTEWPEKFGQTRERYREHLRAAFLPIVTGDKHRAPNIETFLKTRFKVYWYVSKAPPGLGEGRIQIRSAGHRIRYSCRPLFGLDNCRLEHDDRMQEVLVYTPNPKAKKRIEHRVAPRPAFGALRDMKKQLAGRHARFIVGALAGKAYKTITKLVGRKEVHEQEKTGRKLMGAYWRDPEDPYSEWRFVDPRELRRL